MYIKMLKYVFISLIVLSSCKTYANLIVDVEFTFYDLGSGGFTGTDLDDDGVITLGELTEFTFIGAGFFLGAPDASLSNIKSLQDFYYLDTPSWPLSNYPAFTWGDIDTTFSIGAGNYEIISIQTGTAEIPEPTSLAIFTLGLIGLASRRFKKQF